MKHFKLSALFVLFVLVAPAFAQKMKPEELLAKHLDSIGTAEARASVKSLIAVGDVAAKFVSQKNQVVQGRIVLASAGEKNFFGMNLNSSVYSGEKFSYDGKKAKIGVVQAGAYSILGNFIKSNSMVLEESLLGGTLSTSWALLNTAEKKAKLSSGGAKKIDGREVYALGYSPKGGGDVDIVLYFDKETFRHVRTEYKRISSAGIGTRPEQSSGMSESRLKVVEDFSDFRTENGLTLPRGYRIFYSITGQNGTTEVEWTFSLTEFALNQKLDAKTFDAEATN
jgi:hypothetical protein